MTVPLCHNRVKLGVHEETGEQVAVKIMDKSDIKAQEMTLNVRREIAIMKALKHRNIVNLRQVLTSQSKLYIVMDLVTGGELFTKILKEGKLPEDTARHYFQQLVDGIEYCHRRGVCHRDLKPENLLIDETTGELKITDFGLSAMKGASTTEELLHTQCGSPNYCAPEIIARHKQGYNGAKVDAWSCGIILFALLAGYLPFYDENTKVLYRMIQRDDVKFPKKFPSDAKDLILRLLHKDPDQRFTLPDVKKHRWFLINYTGDSGQNPNPNPSPTAPGRRKRQGRHGRKSSVDHVPRLRDFAPGKKSDKSDDGQLRSSAPSPPAIARHPAPPAVIDASPRYTPTSQRPPTAPAVPSSHLPVAPPTIGTSPVRVTPPEFVQTPLSVRPPEPPVPPPDPYQIPSLAKIPPFGQTPRPPPPYESPVPFSSKVASAVSTPKTSGTMPPPYTIPSYANNRAPPNHDTRATRQAEDPLSGINDFIPPTRLADGNHVPRFPPPPSPYTQSSDVLKVQPPPIPPPPPPSNTFSHYPPVMQSDGYEILNPPASLPGKVFMEMESTFKSRSSDNSPSARPGTFTSKSNEDLSKTMMPHRTPLFKKNVAPPPPPYAPANAPPPATSVTNDTQSKTESCASQKPDMQLSADVSDNNVDEMVSNLKYDVDDKALSLVERRKMIYNKHGDDSDSKSNEESTLNNTPHQDNVANVHIENKSLPDLPSDGRGEVQTSVVSPVPESPDAKNAYDGDADSTVSNNLKKSISREDKPPSLRQENTLETSSGLFNEKGQKDSYDPATEIPLKERLAAAVARYRRIFRLGGKIGITASPSFSSNKGNVNPYDTAREDEKHMKKSPSRKMDFFSRAKAVTGAWGIILSQELEEDSDSEDERPMVTEAELNAFSRLLDFWDNRRTSASVPSGSEVLLDDEESSPLSEDDIANIQSLLYKLEPKPVEEEVTEVAEETEGSVERGASFVDNNKGEGEGEGPQNGFQNSVLLSDTNKRLGSSKSFDANMNGNSRDNTCEGNTSHNDSSEIITTITAEEIQSNVGSSDVVESTKDLPSSDPSVLSSDTTQLSRQLGNEPKDAFTLPSLSRDYSNGSDAGKVQINGNGLRSTETEQPQDCDPVTGDASYAKQESDTEYSKAASGENGSKGGDVEADQRLVVTPSTVRDPFRPSGPPIYHSGKSGSDMSDSGTNKSRPKVRVDLADTYKSSSGDNATRNKEGLLSGSKRKSSVTGSDLDGDVRKPVPRDSGRMQSGPSNTSDGSGSGRKRGHMRTPSREDHSTRGLFAFNMFNRRKSFAMTSFVSELRPEECLLEIGNILVAMGCTVMMKKGENKMKCEAPIKQETLKISITCTHENNASTVHLKKARRDKSQVDAKEFYEFFQVVHARFHERVESVDSRD